MISPQRIFPVSPLHSNLRMNIHQLLLQLFPCLLSRNYIADVVGSFSEAIRYESTLLEHGDFELRINSFCSGSSTGASSRTANDNEPLSV